MAQVISKYYVSKCVRCTKPIEIGTPIENVELVFGKKSWVHIGCTCNEKNGMEAVTYRPKSTYTAPKSSRNSAMSNETKAFMALGENFSLNDIDFKGTVTVFWVYDRTHGNFHGKYVSAFHMYNHKINLNFYVDESGMIYSYAPEYWAITNHQHMTVTEWGYESFIPMEVK